MLASIIVCGLGYAEGARLTKDLGGWQVICWALVMSLPLMMLLTFITLPANLSAISQQAWISLGYVSVFSMLIGFVFWYRGLSIGGIAAISQLQLLQPFLGMVISATVLGEIVSSEMLGISLGVILFVAMSKKFAC